MTDAAELTEREKLARIIAQELGEAFEILPDEHFEPSFCKEDFLRAADAVLAAQEDEAERSSNSMYRAGLQER